MKKLKIKKQGIQFNFKVSITFLIFILLASALLIFLFSPKVNAFGIESVYVTHSPLDVRAGDRVTVTATPIGFLYDLAQVKLYYTVSDGSSGTLLMSSGSGDYYSATLSYGEYVGAGHTLTYYVKATDVEGNSAQSPTKSFTVGDDYAGDPPPLPPQPTVEVSLTSYPTSIYVDETAQITAYAVGNPDTANVGEVKLHYKNGLLSSYTTVVMINPSASDLYSVSIGGFEAGDRIYFYVEAFLAGGDISSHTSTESFTVMSLEEETTDPPPETTDPTTDPPETTDPTDPNNPANPSNPIIIPIEKLIPGSFGTIVFVAVVIGGILIYRRRKK